MRAGFDIVPLNLSGVPWVAAARRVESDRRATRRTLKVSSTQGQERRSPQSGRREASSIVLVRDDPARIGRGITRVTRRESATERQAQKRAVTKRRRPCKRVNIALLSDFFSTNHFPPCGN